MVFLTRGTRKGTPHLLGLGRGGLSPKTQAHEGSYRECLVHTEVVFLSQAVAGFTCPSQTHPCLQKGSTCQPKDVPCLGEFYEY